MENGKLNVSVAGVTKLRKIQTIFHKIGTLPLGRKKKISSNFCSGNFLCLSIQHPFATRSLSCGMEPALPKKQIDSCLEETGINSTL